MGILIAKSSGPPPPDPPGAFTATMGAATSSTLSVSWTASARADSYRVYLSETNAKGSLVASGVSSPHVVTDLDPETEYWVTIEAVNAGGTTDSNRVTGETAAPAAGILWASDWSNSTGTSSAALLDGSGDSRKWEQYENYGGANLLSVVSASGLGFPAGMSNVLRVQYRGENAGHLENESRYAFEDTLTVGDSVCVRIYTRCDIRDAAGNLSDSSHHPWQNRQGAPEWELKPAVRNNGTWIPKLSYAGQTSVMPGDWGRFGATFLGTFNKGQVYRFELLWTLEAAGEWSLNTRVDGVDWDSSLVDTDLGTSLAQTRYPWYFPTDRIRQIFVGNNGPSWSASHDDDCWYYGGAIFTLNRWAGAYDPGEAE